MYRDHVERGTSSIDQQIYIKKRRLEDFRPRDRISRNIEVTGAIYDFSLLVKKKDEIVIRWSEIVSRFS